MENPTLVTPLELGRLLSPSASKLTESQLKDILQESVDVASGQPLCLSAPTPEDLATWFVILLGMAFPRKFEDEVARLQSLTLTGKELDEALANADAHWPMTALLRDKDGRCKRGDKNKLLTAVSPSKVVKLIENNQVGKMLEGVDLGEPSKVDNLQKAAQSIATHPVKLSVEVGTRKDVNGGFLKASTVTLDPVFEGSVCEQDFEVGYVYGLTGSASLQKSTTFLFTKILFQGQHDDFCTLLKTHPAAKAALAAGMQRYPEVKGWEVLVEALVNAGKCALSGAPEVFCGSTQELSVVAPLMPLSLPAEIRNGKEVIRQAYRDGLQQQLTLEETTLADAEAALAELKTTAKGKTRADKAAVKSQQEAAKKLVDEKKQKVAQLKASIADPSKSLAIPYFSMPIGGAQPQNVASGVTKAIQSSNIFTRIRERAPRATVGNKVFYPRQLVVRPEFNTAEPLPRTFTSAKLGAPAKRARTAFFRDLALSSLTQMLELKEAYEQGTQESVKALYEEVLVEIDRAYEKPPAFVVFIKGLPGATPAAAQELLKPLVEDVCAQIRAALHQAYKDVSISEFESELQAAVSGVVLTERA